MEQFRVSFVVGVLDRGGAEKQLYYMLRTLKEHGIETHIYAIANSGSYVELIQDLNIPLYWIGKASSPILRVKILASYLIRFKPHVIQSSHFYTNLYSITTGFLLNVPHIGAMRNDLYHHLYTGGIDRWAPYLIKYPKILAINSYNAHREVIDKKLISPNKARVLPNVIDLEQFDQQSQLVSNLLRINEEIRVVLVARLVPAKRIDLFLRAIAKARESNPNITSYIVGDGPERDALQTLASELGLLAMDGVRFLGESNNVPAILKNMDILVLSSENEGFPNVLLEAMAAFLPIVTTTVGDAPHIVENGINGYLVAKGDWEDLANRIVELANSKEIRQSMGHEGRKKVEEKYTYSRLFHYLMAIYKDAGVQHACLDDY